MTRAPASVAAAFAVSATLAILLSGPLLLFNPWFVAFEQGRHGVPAALGAPPAEVDRVTGALLGDLFTNGDFGAGLQAGEPLLDAEERSHMRDVGGLVRTLVALDLLALVTLTLAGRRLRDEAARRGRLLLASAAGIGLAAVVLALLFALAFQVAFAAFHALFFAPGSWTFGPDSHLLALFPQPFWFEIALVAGGSIVLTALLAALLARRDLARARVTGG